MNSIDLDPRHFTSIGKRLPMMAIIALPFAVTLPLFTIGMAFCSLGGLARFLRNPGRNGNWAKHLSLLQKGLLLIAASYFACKVWEYRLVLARVPYPLHAYWVDYRNEVSGGMGLPGDNETGLVVYRLTPGSTKWAKDNAATLDDLLPGGTMDWRKTPVDDRADGGLRWHRHGNDQSNPGHTADIEEYLGQYGFGIQIDRSQVDAVNRAIRSPGSFYEYGPGGSITIVDPANGKVYFAYAG